MKALFDVSHPAHVHLFKNAIRELEAMGQETHVTSREKDVTTQLLDAYGIDHTPLSAMGTGRFAHVVEWVAREARLLRVARAVDPDVIVSHLNPPAAHVARVLDRPSLVFFDDVKEPRMVVALTKPFASVICTPRVFPADLGPKHRRYDGYHELAYLHPDRFTPDPARLRRHGIDADEPYYVLRFVAWAATHDVGQHGFSTAAKQELVAELSTRGDVYITSESPLPAPFEAHRLPVPPEDIHHLLAFADVYVGDSQTMATEAAVLGTPAVRSNTFAGPDDMRNFVELEREYGLLHSTADEDAAIARALELADDGGARRTWERRRARLVDETIDVTRYMVDLILEHGARTPTGAEAVTP